MAVRFCLSSNLKHLFYVLIASSLYPSLAFANLQSIDKQFAEITKYVRGDAQLELQSGGPSARPLPKSMGGKGLASSNGDSNSQSGDGPSKITNITNITNVDGAGGKGLADANTNGGTDNQSTNEAKTAVLKTAGAVLGDKGLATGGANKEGGAPKAKTPGSDSGPDSPSTPLTPTTSPLASLGGSGSGTDLSKFTEQSASVLKALGSVVAPVTTMFASAGNDTYRAYKTAMEKPTNAGGDDGPPRPAPTPTPTPTPALATTTASGGTSAQSAADTALATRIALASAQPSQAAMAQREKFEQAFSDPKKGSNSDAEHTGKPEVTKVDPKPSATPKSTVASTRPQATSDDIEDSSSGARGKASSTKGTVQPSSDGCDLSERGFKSRLAGVGGNTCRSDTVGGNQFVCYGSNVSDLDLIVSCFNKYNKSQTKDADGNTVDLKARAKYGGFCVTGNARTNRGELVAFTQFGLQDPCMSSEGTPRVPERH